MAELLGRSSGVSKGRGGSMHMGDAERNWWGGYGIVGGHLPLATGNKSYLSTGYCTLYGDMSGGLSGIVDVLDT